MAWVQLGSRKINTALICYLEQEDEKLRLHFQGRDLPVELQPEEAAALWKHLKAENLLGVKDKGSTMVLPKRWSGAPPDAVPANGTPAKPLQVAVGPGSNEPAVAAQPSASPSKPPSSHSQGHSSPRPQHSPSHSSSSHRSSSHAQPSSSQHRSSSHGHSSSSSSSKPTDSARVLDFKKE